MSPAICHHQRGEVRFRLRHELVCGFSAFSLIVEDLLKTVTLYGAFHKISTPYYKYPVGRDPDVDYSGPRSGTSDPELEEQP
jgi:hypothetical protein